MPDGGAYDGPLGVVSALLAVQALQDRGFAPARPIGVANFVDEEGARFGVACAGSRIITGALGADRARGLRRVAERVRDRRRYLPRARRSARERVAADAAAWQDRAESLGGRPPGQLRALVLPELTDLQRWFAERAYAAMDPDGTLGRDEDLEEQSRPD